MSISFNRQIDLMNCAGLVRSKGERSIDLSVPTYAVPAAATSGGGRPGSFADSRHT